MDYRDIDLIVKGMSRIADALEDIASELKAIESTIDSKE